VKINNITLSISDYINNIYELLLTIRDKLLDLMEIEQIPLVQIGNTNTQIKRWPLFVMLSTAIVCLSLSATFHLFQTHSKTVNTITSRLDYAGISILIAGSCYPPYFYFFQCETFIRNAYLTFISVFAISVFLYSLTSDFHLPERRTLRGSLFLALGLSAAIPIFHLIFFRSTVRGFDTMPRLTFWYIGGISYVSGALMYIKRIPERYPDITINDCFNAFIYPSRFNISNLSHKFGYVSLDIFDEGIIHNICIDAEKLYELYLNNDSCSCTILT
jgi:channel protein (hemolysin III family)